MHDDLYPGQPRILFIGPAQSTHTHGTVDLLNDSGWNVRVFSVPTPYFPPPQWQQRVYISYDGPTPPDAQPLDPRTRHRLYPEPVTEPQGLVRRVLRQFEISLDYRLKRNLPLPPEAWLARIIQEWQPDVIETLGFNPSGSFYLRSRKQYDLAGIGRWSLTIRGAPDYELDRYHPVIGPELVDMLHTADMILSDNVRCLEDAVEMGAVPEKISPVGAIPGAGGLDVSAMRARWQGKPSERRVIVMPKTYESSWSVTLPVFEALQRVWDQIQPCEIYMLAMITEPTEKWYWHLPEHIRAHCHVIKGRIPHDDLVQLMTRTRVMLAPSLLDGMPNVILEAMAGGALPVVSPIPTLVPHFTDEQHVLYARNLYPDEIAAALVRAMTDDALVDRITESNVAWVRAYADKALVKQRAVDYYTALMGQRA
ncbi:MAG: hypothetical protein OHK0046_24400 [Anaerolineae bacterium]